MQYKVIFTENKNTVKILSSIGLMFRIWPKYKRTRTGTQ